MIRGRNLNIKTKTKKNNIKLLVVTIILAILVVVISGSTYALWIVDTSQTSVNVVDSTCLNLNVVENTSINLQNAYQTSDSEALKQVPYNFTIVNNCSNSEIVDIQLDLKDTNTLNNSDIRITLIEADTNKNFVEPTNLNSLTNVTETNETGYSKAKELNTVSIKGNSSKSFNLYIWVKSDASYDDISNKIFNGKIEIENVENINMLATNYIKMMDENDDLAYDETTDNNLRYIGADPDNYVEFNDELWRVIGVMNNIDDGTGNKETRVKLIRAESLGNYAFSEACSDSEITEDGTSCTTWSYNNYWPTSNLNSMLNNEYLNRSTGTPYNSYLYTNKAWTIGKSSSDFTNNGISTYYRSFISNAVYYLGGVQDTNKDGTYYYETMTASDYYTAERNTYTYNDNEASWTGIVGLMYPSDYGYATSGGSTITKSECTSKELYNWNSTDYSDCRGNDWLLDSTWYQWTITSRFDSSLGVMIVYYGGIVDGYSTYYGSAVRPVLYLNSSVKIVGGSGSKTDPYQLSL